MVCAQDGLAPGRASGHYGVQSCSQRRGAWDPGRLGSSAHAVPTLWGSLPQPHPQLSVPPEIEFTPIPNSYCFQVQTGRWAPKAPPSRIIYPPTPRLHFSA